MDVTLARKLAVILHADVVESTALVQRNETLAHLRIRDAFRRLAGIIASHGGKTSELRGDALVAEFQRGSDAIAASLAFQTLNAAENGKLRDELRPELRIGIAMGEVVIADNTMTGVGVVLAQRLEQLAEPGAVVVQGSVADTVPTRLPYEFSNLGEHELKGFGQPVRVFGVSVKPEGDVSELESSPGVGATPTDGGAQRKLVALLAAHVVDYARLMRADEEWTLTSLKVLRKSLIDPSISTHRGNVVRTSGDGLLIEFPSVVEAVRNAVEVQQSVHERIGRAAGEEHIRFRVGVNIGDVILDGDEIYGDGINVAAHLQEFASPGGVCLSEDAYNHVRDKVDFEFVAIGERALENVARPVRIWQWCGDPAQGAAGAPKKAGERASSEKISIAVLPFDNMSGDPEQEYFSDGITEDLITDLSKISEMFVVARNATFAYKGKPVLPQEIGEELGVRHVLEGSVRKAGARVRITAQLIDASSGGHVWAERYDRDLTDIFTLQDEITGEIVSTLKAKLTKSEEQQVANRYTDDLEAYDYFLRGRAYQARTTRESNAQAQEMFRKAIELDPSFAGAYAQVSYSLFRDWLYQWSDDRGALDQAEEMARRAVELDSSLPLAWMYLGWTHSFKRQHPEAVAEGRRAIELDPNFAEGHAYLGMIMSAAGRPEEGVGLLDRAMLLDPHYPPIYLFFLGFAHYAMGQHEQAISELRRALARSPDHFSTHRTLAILYSELGREDDARAEVGEMIRISPDATLQDQMDRMPVPFSEQSRLEQYVEWLRRAGLPE